MNEYLQTHTWVGHLEFWSCIKVAMIFMIVAISAGVLFFCFLVVLDQMLDAYQEWKVRRSRLKSYRVGDVITPEITRAWLRAMNSPRSK
jgi:hypothetical protein